MGKSLSHAVMCLGRESKLSEVGVANSGIFRSPFGLVAATKEVPLSIFAIWTGL